LTFDIFIESCHKIETCNSWVVRSEKIFREKAGLEGREAWLNCKKPSMSLSSPVAG